MILPEPSHIEERIRRWLSFPILQLLAVAAALVLSAGSPSESAAQDPAALEKQAEPTEAAPTQPKVAPGKLGAGTRSQPIPVKPGASEGAALGTEAGPQGATAGGKTQAGSSNSGPPAANLRGSGSPGGLKGRTPGGPPRAAPALPRPLAQPEASPRPTAPAEKGLLSRLVNFVVPHALWIFFALVAGVGAFLYFSLRGAPSREPAGEPVERRFPVSPVEDDEEGPRRVLAGTAPPPSLEREYALVVKEEDLKMPPLPEEAATGRRRGGSTAIQELLAHSSFDEAYRSYLQEIETDRRVAFDPDLERRLGEHFIRSGEMDKAARILEHHVATQPGDEIEPETYFNLAYIHFKGKTLQKSRRYFRLFVERHTDPVQVDRARKILARLEKVQGLN